MKKRWLSYRGVTELTSLSESTVRRLILEGKFPAPEDVTEGRKVFDHEAVERAMECLLDERRHAASAPSARPPEAA